MMTKEEYLRLIYEAYTRDNEDEKEEYAWIPAESELKEKIQKLIKPSGDINATNIKKAELSKIINKYNRITIGEFMIYIKSIVNPTDNPNIVKEATTISEVSIYNIVIYENKRVTPSGMPCNIQVKLNIAKDNRFQNVKWNKGFSQFGGSTTSNNLVNLIKWMQAITKIPAFL